MSAGSWLTKLDTRCVACGHDLAWHARPKDESEIAGPCEAPLCECQGFEVGLSLPRSHRLKL